MKIMLIQPPNSPVTIGGEDVFLYEPLALEYIAAGVAQAMTSASWTCDWKRTCRMSWRFQRQLVGITAYSVHVNVVRRLFDQIEQWNPGVLTARRPPRHGGADRFSPAFY